MSYCPSIHTHYLCVSSGSYQIVLGRNVLLDPEMFFNFHFSYVWLLVFSPWVLLIDVHIFNSVLPAQGIGLRNGTQVTSW